MVITGVRAYSGNDSLKSINWKATAKNQQLLVNKYDYTADKRIMIILNLERQEYSLKKEDIQTIEATIEVCASTASMMHETGIPVGFATNSHTLGPAETNVLDPDTGDKHMTALLESLFANKIVSGSRISIVFFIITALCGLFINFLPYNSYDKRTHSLIFGFIGLALAVLSIGISSINGFNLFALPIGFIALIFLYYRSYTSYLANVRYVYAVESFYQSVSFLFIINTAVVFWSRSFGAISDELMRYSVLYIIMALYMLSEVKSFRYVNRNENSRKAAFDMAASKSHLD